jgi:LmbE family N-acetylglucosaminyl deacetylase
LIFSATRLSPSRTAFAPGCAAVAARVLRLPPVVRRRCCDRAVAGKSIKQATVKMQARFNPKRLFIPSTSQGFNFYSPVDHRLFRLFL